MQECVGEDVLHAGREGIDPDFFKRGNEARDHEVPLVVADILHHVKADGCSMSNGAKYTTSFLRCSGMYSSKRSAVGRAGR